MRTPLSSIFGATAGSGERHLHRSGPQPPIPCPHAFGPGRLRPGTLRCRGRRGRRADARRATTCWSRCTRSASRFPDLLLSRGEYQLKPEPPFTLGVDFAGTVRAAPDGRVRGRAAGRRRACRTAAAAELVAVPADVAVPAARRAVVREGRGAADELPDRAVRAGRRAAQLRAGETVLVHGAAGGVGTATIQVAKGYGARTIAVVSTEEKADFVRRARRRRGGARRRVPGRGQGADRRPRASTWSSTSSAATCSPTRCAALGAQGRLLVVGFTGGQGIPEVKVNRLLLNNIDVRGVGWGAYAMVRPGYMREQWDALAADDGVRGRGPADRGDVRPRGGRPARSPTWSERRMLGKSVLLAALTPCAKVKFRCADRLGSAVALPLSCPCCSRAAGRLHRRVRRRRVASRAEAPSTAGARPPPSWAPAPDGTTG